MKSGSRGLRGPDFVSSAWSVAALGVLLGGPLEGALWFSVFAATGAFFYHSNFKSPHDGGEKQFASNTESKL